MASFDLMRCSNVSICEPHDIDQKSALPPPQKFPARTNIAPDRNTKCVYNHSDPACFKGKSCKATGVMISQRETANWICSDEQRHISAYKAAKLIAAHKSGRR